jgi:hypothetical protein
MPEEEEPRGSALTQNYHLEPQMSVRNSTGALLRRELQMREEEHGAHD